MKCIAAPNAFKESLDASRAAQAIKRGVLKANPKAEIIECPLADGGDGFLDAISKLCTTQRISCSAQNANGEVIESYYLMDQQGHAFIEMAEVNGLKQIPIEDRQPLRASSYGLGQLILDALQKGASQITLGIGGSASTDGGAGAAQALGFLLLDESEQQLSPGGGQLHNLQSIHIGNVPTTLKTCQFTIACDVDNPLLGSRGCAQVFSPQKGAQPEDVKILENNLSHYADLVETFFNVSTKDRSGAGAAGGLGFFAETFLNAQLISGAELLLNLSHFEDHLQGADLIITAEGALDGQTEGGKLPAVIAQKGQAHQIPVIALVGSLKPGWENLKTLGLTSAFAIAPGPVSLDQSMTQAETFLENTATELISTIVPYLKA